MKITLTILLAAMALPCMAMTEIPGQAGNDGRGQAGNDETVMADLIGHLTDQSGNDGRAVKMAVGRAQIVQVQMEDRLVLRTGQKSLNANASFYPDDIELLLDESMWRRLEDLMDAPFGKTLKVTDVYGFAVNIAKARVFNQEGLMFTMGTRNVTITADDFKKLKRK